MKSKIIFTISLVICFRVSFSGNSFLPSESIPIYKLLSIYPQANALMNSSAFLYAENDDLHRLKKYGKLDIPSNVTSSLILFEYSAIAYAQDSPKGKALIIYGKDDSLCWNQTKTEIHSRFNAKDIHPNKMVYYFKKNKTYMAIGKDATDLASDIGNIRIKLGCHESNEINLHQLVNVEEVADILDQKLNDLLLQDNGSIIILPQKNAHSLFGILNGNANTGLGPMVLVTGALGKTIYGMLESIQSDVWFSGNSVLLFTEGLARHIVDNLMPLKFRRSLSDGQNLWITGKETFWLQNKNIVKDIDKQGIWGFSVFTTYEKNAFSIFEALMKELKIHRGTVFGTILNAGSYIKEFGFKENDFFSLFHVDSETNCLVLNMAHSYSDEPDAAIKLVDNKGIEFVFVKGLTPSLLAAYKRPFNNFYVDFNPFTK